MPSGSFWRGRRVLLTGATGFKGGWLAIWLRRLGASVTGLGLEAPALSLFEASGLAGLIDNSIVDIRDADTLSDLVRRAEPEIVFHLAAQPLVRASYQSPVETFATNVQGTVNVLEACRGAPSVRTIVAITTDKVYANLEHVLPYREDDRLGGHDPYSASKAACEIAIDCYRRSFLATAGVGLASARAGNVIGGGDWSQDRLLPDAVRAWSSGSTLVIRRPDAVRPWQHVLEPLAGYLLLAERLSAQPDLAGAFNMGPHTHEAADVRTVVELAQRSYGAGVVEFGQAEGPHEAGLLTLETAKARSVLGLAPRWSLAQCVDRTMQWYRAFYDGGDALSLCERDIDGWEQAQCGG
ncbi:CDP-glucose 4,6-dehydratase [Sphingomonas changnyeongensis]|uniref:CDP-glucose 4,6-dehydratase n=1 Tax=Sphingomonas changnyeongensis TaxID=2698679 RepID=A0A7Z2S647_9SPHN|nr:CDP-glucose 4,6-dehydratase [Sphingomonas changnyeongensis]QHL91785.1 CDP-glucose 4,6-dehydratase [Sphingomonas changnyeongensis]